MATISLTAANIRAAAQDAGNLSMKAAGRKCWNREDWNAATRVDITLRVAHGLIPVEALDELPAPAAQAFE